MNVLGLNTMENASAALAVNGRITAAAEEERFTRKKHQEGVPLHALRYCLEQQGLTLSDIDVVALNWQPWRLYRRAMHVMQYGLTSPRRFLIKVGRGVKQVGGGEWRRMLSLPGKLPQLLGVDPKQCRYRFRFIDHHACHAAGAFYPSPFARAAVLTLDGAGESSGITLNRGSGKGIKRLKSIDLPHSLGHLYSAATAFLGFRPCGGEGKVMGLAPYGEPLYLDRFSRMVRLRDGGGLSMNFKTLDYHLALSGIFPTATHRAFGPPREQEAPLEKRYRDIAASLQVTLEEGAMHLARHLHRETGLESLCLAGGVTLNARMNQRLLEETPFKRIFIQPAANDAGTSLGAALAAVPHGGTVERHAMEHVYLGPGFDNNAIEKCIAQKGLTAKRCAHIETAAARLVAKGNIVGWFQGRLEFGPRALGNRSILADPRRADMKGYLNHRVKHREAFRPFAPAVLDERAAEYFNTAGETRFMNLIAGVLPRARNIIPAVVHVDGTARLQTVSRETNPRFYKLIEAFDQLTGVPVVVNTSFNIRGEPIVCTPEDAIACYLGTGMDALAIGDFLLQKEQEKHQPPPIGGMEGNGGVGIM